MLRWLRGFASTLHHFLSLLQIGHSGRFFRPAGCFYHWEKIKRDQFTDSKFLNSRLLVSQDRENIYLTFAEFNSSYVHYIRETTPGPNVSTPRGKKPSTGSNFLKMNEYGPFNIGKDNHMDSLGHILLAFTIRACEI